MSEHRRTRYGYFTEDGREYITTAYETPRPWINYLSNERYCALCSNTGGGYAFFESSGFDRITGEVPPITVYNDRPGRYVYLRDQDSGEYWAANWQPVRKPPDRWLSRHGQGYTSFESAYNGIGAHVTYFVPLEDNLELWLISLKNESDRPRRLSMFCFVEWVLGNYAFQLIESSFARLFQQVQMEQPSQIIFATSRYWNVAGGAATSNPNLAWDKVAFMAGDYQVHGYDCSGEAFIGPFRLWHCPIAVEEGRCRNTDSHGRSSVGVLQHNLELAPGEERTFTTMIGIAYDRREVLPLVRKYRHGRVAQAELKRVRQYWDDYLARVAVATPDPDFDLSHNIWNKYQTWVTSHWSRMDSYYIGGASILGFRDSWQDLLAPMVNDPLWAQTRLTYLLSHQFSDGGTLHNWDPRTNIGVRTGHSDDPMWLVMGMVWYLKETGDFDILSQDVDYYDGPIGTVYEHMTRAMDYTLSRRSSRGIPLMMAADWNDGLDQVGREGRGESVMVAEHLAWMLREMAPLAERLGEPDRAEHYRREYEHLKECVNTYFWESRWYARATTDEGRVIGCSICSEGQMYVNAQSWAVLSGIAEGERAFKAMDGVWRHLDTPYGPAIFLPAYVEPEEDIGIITRFAPGTKENGTIFNHPVAWAIMAECVLGRGDKAFEMWQKNNFTHAAMDPDRYKAEPYVYCEYINGPQSQDFGEGNFTWMTGTASWMWRVCLDWILGVKPDWDRLRIDPCLPPSWDHAHVRRPWRGAVYEITIENPEHLSKGKIELEVDGERLDGDTLPDYGDGAIHHVRAVLHPAEVPVALGAA